jgi:hypothetical protein
VLGRLKSPWLAVIMQTSTDDRTQTSTEKCTQTDTDRGPLDEGGAGMMARQPSGSVEVCRSPISDHGDSLVARQTGGATARSGRFDRGSRMFVF